jgi:hypothetical protein
MMAVQPESAAAAGAVGSLVRQRGQRKIRPSGSSTSCDTQPHDLLGHRVLTVIGNPLPPCRQFRRPSCRAGLDTDIRTQQAKPSIALPSGRASTGRSRSSGLLDESYSHPIPSLLAEDLAATIGTMKLTGNDAQAYRRQLLL